jgi:probable HAF family extracellular repeat protein
VILNSLGGDGSASGVNDLGWVAGYSYFSGDQKLHATLWTLLPSRVIDLGTLGGPNSFVFNFTDDLGLIAGNSDTKTPDPLGEDFCGFGTGDICEGVLWARGLPTIVLPPLPGGNNSAPFDANDRGQVAGTSEIATSEDNPDCAPQVREYEAAIWQPFQYNHPIELPPVPGDADAQAYVINNNGDAAGVSGFCDNARHPVLWRHGQTIALPTLGDTHANIVYGLNAFGEAVGQLGVPGTLTSHAALWKTPKSVVDLGTFPGDPISAIIGINDWGQSVGFSGGSTTQRAALWQNGVVYDLNTLIAPNARYDLVAAQGISNDGLIAGGAIDAETGSEVSFALIPTGPLPERAPANAVRPLTLPSSVLQRIRQRGLRRFAASF